LDVLIRHEELVKYRRQPHLFPRGSRFARVVALQVAFERQTLKPGYHLIGNHLKPGAFKLWVNRIQRAEPHRVLFSRLRALLDVSVQVAFEAAHFETRFSLDRRKG
jgi:hypothetical protein